MGTLIQTFPDGGSGGGASAGMIADEFSTSVDYTVGDLVIYDKTLYKFTSAHSAGAWDPSDVTDDVTVDSELKLKQNLSDTFNGTLQQWEALPLATKLTYKYANITNDPTEQLEIVSADIDIENHVVHLDGDELVGLNGIWKTQGEYGVKNLIPYPYYDGTSKTITGITYTVNSDGSVTTNGTSTGNALFYMVFRQQPHNLKAGRYKISGCPSGGSTDTYYIWMGFWNGSSNTNSVYETGNGATIDVLETSENLQLVIKCVVKSGSNMDGKIFKPMLRVAADTDDTYRPYAKTNKQLTDEISGNASDIDEIDERLDNTTTAVTGNPISITGLKSNQLAKDPVITFEPIQAGTGDPSPSNIRAISGYDKIEVLSCGKNLIRYNELPLSSNNVTLKEGANHELIIDGTASATLTPAICRIYKNEIIPGKYCISTQSGGLNIFVNANNGNTYVRTLVNSTGTSFMLTFDDYDNIHIGVVINSGASFSNTANYIQLEQGENVTTYEAPIKTTDLSLQLGQTIYGGTLDVEKGILTVDKGIELDLSQGTWALYATNSFYSDSFTTLFSETRSGICSAYKNHGTGSTALELENGEFIGDTNGRIYIKNESYSDATAFTNSLVNVQFCSSIQPFTIQLTPHEISLLKDYAYVSTNGTNMQFSYKNGEMASLGDVAQLGETVNQLERETINQISTLTSRTPNNITSRLSMLPSAVAEQNLEKYGYKIGDYFVGTSQSSNNFTYWLADMDTFYGGYDHFAVEYTHHIGIIVDTYTYSQWYTGSDITDVGYDVSTLHTYLSGTVLNIVKADMIALFGGSTGLEHLLGQTKLWNKLGTWYWSDENTHSQYIAALTEAQLTGTRLWSVDNFQQGEGHKQLQIFDKYCYSQIFVWRHIWLRSIQSSSHACSASANGISDSNDVTLSYGVAGLILFH